MYVVTPHKNRLDRMVLMVGHKICFYGKIWLVIPKLSLLPFLSGTLLNSKSAFFYSAVRGVFPYQNNRENLDPPYNLFLLKECEKLLHCKSLSHFFNKKISVYLVI